MEGSVTTESVLRPLVEELHERRAKAKLGGGEEKIAQQHERDKLTARERLDLLIDEALEFLRSQLSLTFTTEDIVEGVTAFFEKRDPQWKGR